MGSDLSEILHAHLYLDTQFLAELAVEAVEDLLAGVEEPSRDIEAALLGIPRPLRDERFPIGNDDAARGRRRAPVPGPAAVGTGLTFSIRRDLEIGCAGRTEV